jgi:hypothetical protein
MPAALSLQPLAISDASARRFLVVPAAPLRARPFDGAALVILPRLAKVLGYAFKVGNDADLRRDAAFVVTTVLGADGLLPTADVAWFGQRYDDATTWVVAYCGSLPVGALAIQDMRQASLGLDLAGRVVPPELKLARTRELGRLAVLQHHRSSAVIPTGLLLTALSWMLDNEVNHVFAAADARLSHLLNALCPTAREVDAASDRSVDVTRDRYFKRRRLAAGPPQLLTFDVASAWTWRFLWQQMIGWGRGSTVAQRVLVC